MLGPARREPGDRMQSKLTERVAPEASESRAGWILSVFKSSILPVGYRILFTRSCMGCDHRFFTRKETLTLLDCLRWLCE